MIKSLIILLLLAPLALAEVQESRVIIANFNYDDGLVTYKEKTIKFGYAPDYKLEPEDGYKAELLSFDDKELASFRFDIPLKLYFDMSDPLLKTLSGGMVILNETDFALVFPYDERAEKIVISNPRNYTILEVPLVEEKLSISRASYGFYILPFAVLFAIFAFMAYIKFRKK
ncbi:MAG TPA: hypothetical protein VFF28_08090 [Candidatus Nanoarchaeia archaeon]|nr:hypothetical protein [Candidatus Nanoarchaeia archaeon]